MKKFVAILLFLSLFTCFSACNKNPNNTSSNQETITNNSFVDSDETSYEDIICKEASGYNSINLVANKSKTVLNISIPNNWSIIKNNTGYKVMASSKEIGNISFEVNIPNEAEKLFNSKFTSLDIDITHTIYSLNEQYWRKINFDYNNENIALNVLYSEIDSSSIFELLTEAKLLRASTEPNFNLINIGSRNKILILGNSFIATSNIGDLLSDMCNGNAFIDARSRGNANVATFTGDGYTLNEIRSGNYAALFMCGFYSLNAVNEFEKIINACNASGTKIVIFPAHNESREAINSAIRKYNNTILLDWKAEIDALIESGISKSYFCRDDSVSHSTPLAGYVGAHMIYRAIYGKVPPKSKDSSFNVLGNYIYSGTIKFMNDDLFKNKI